MTDIVERLRLASKHSSILRQSEQIVSEAAYEIERLRDEGKKDYDGMREFQQKFIDASHEISRLRQLITVSHLDDVLAENQRLRELLRELLAGEGTTTEYINCVREALGD